MANLTRENVAKIVGTGIPIRKHHQLPVAWITTMRELLIIRCMRADAIHVAGIRSAAVSMTAVDRRQAGIQGTRHRRTDGAGDHHASATQRGQLVPDSGLGSA